MSIKSVFTKIVEHLIYEGWHIFYFLFLNFTAHAVNKLFNFALEYLARAGSGTSKKTRESADQKKALLHKIGYRILASLRFVHTAKRMCLYVHVRSAPEPIHEKKEST